MTAQGAALVMVLSLLSVSARAAPVDASRAVVLRVPSSECAAAPAFAAFVEALQVELASTGPHCCAIETRDRPAQAGAITLDIDPCDPAAGEIEVREVRSEAGVETPSPEARRISLADVRPEARARALALAVAELVRNPRTGAAPVAPPPARPTVAAAPPAARTPWGASLAAEALLRAEPRLDTLLGGGRLALFGFGERWVAGIDADVTLGNRSVDLGKLDARMVHLAGSGGLRVPMGRAALDLSAVAGLGWAWVAGHAARPEVQAESGSGLVATVGLRAGLEAPTSRSLRARVSLEGGQTLGHLTADVNRVPTSGISGPYVLVAVGLGFGLRALSP